MKNIFTAFRISFIFLLLLLTGNSLLAQMTIAPGNWSDPAIWQLGVVPLANANVTIAHNVTLDTDPVINNLTINSTATLQLADKNITVNGTTTIDGTLDRNVGNTPPYIATFNGNVSNNGTFTSTGADGRRFNFSGDITNGTGATFALGTGGNSTIYDFQGMSQTITNNSVNTMVFASGASGFGIVSSSTSTITIGNGIAGGTVGLLGGSIAVDGQLINNYAGGFLEVNLVQGGGNFTNNAYVKAGNAPTISNFFSNASTSTFEYLFDSNVRPTTYHNLIFSYPLPFPSILMGDITVNGNFEMSHANTRLNATTYTIDLRGNWTVQNVNNFNAGTGTVTFSGANAQTITGETTFNNLVINNTNATVANRTITLQTATPITVSNTLTLTSGKLVLGANQLTLSNAVVTPTNTNYIVTNENSSVRYTVIGNFFYPIGDALYAPISITTSSTNTTATVTNNFTGRTPTPSTPYLGGRWIINSTSTPTGITFGSDPTCIFPAQKIYKWNVGAWSDVGINSNCSVAPITPITASAGLTSGLNEYAVFTPPAPTQPLGNRGMYFDGVDDRVELPTTLAGNNTFTISTWIKVKDLSINRDVILSNNLGVTGRFRLSVFVYSDGRVGFATESQSTASDIRRTTNSLVTENEWIYIAVSSNGALNGKQIFVNGVLQPLDIVISSASYLFASAAPLRVGGGGLGGLGYSGSSFLGQIDEVRIFNTVRSAAQIAADMASTTPNTAVGFWDFEEGTGQTTINQGTLGTAANGTLGSSGIGDINDPLWALRVKNTNDTGTENLREVITEANTLVGKNYIDFSIPISSPNYSGGVWTIQPIGTPSNVIEEVIIDGYSAFGSKPATSLLPATITVQLEAPVSNSTLTLSGSSSITVKGLSIAQSVSSGLAALWLSGTAGHKVEGNYIGVNALGTGSYPSSRSDALVIQNSSNNTIGGIDPSQRNIIGGAFKGIRIDGTTSNNNVILGNYIGVQANGTSSLGNRGEGILINGSTAQSNSIGNGTLAGANIIANNGFLDTKAGIEITSSGSVNNPIRYNFIYNNRNGGILLSNAGNNSKPAPLINGTSTPSSVSGTCTCAAGETIELFRDNVTNPVGNKQGEDYLGTVTTIPNAWTMTTFATAPALGDYLTATVTDANGNTSPFSAALLLAGAYYSRDGATNITTTGADWNDAISWTLDPSHAGAAAPTAPSSGSTVVIKSGHTITTDNALPISSVSSITLAGTLDLVNGNHVLCCATSITNDGGTGRLLVGGGIAANSISPTIGDFFTTAGNVVEFYGNGVNYAIPHRDYPTLQIIGTASTKSIVAGTTNIHKDLIVSAGARLDVSVNANFDFTTTADHFITHNGEMNMGSFTINRNTVVNSGGIPAGVVIRGDLTINTGTFTNNGIVRINLPTSNLVGGGSFTAGSGSVLYYNSNNNIGLAVFDVSSDLNEVVYNAGTSPIFAGTYSTLRVWGDRTLSNTTSVQDLLEINATSTLDFGINAATLTLNGNLSATGTIDMSNGSFVGHILNLNGASNDLSTLTTASNGAARVVYGGINVQTIFPSPNYQILEINGGAIKTLQGATTVNNSLTLTNGKVQLDGFDLILANTSAGNQLQGTPNASNYIITNGIGKLTRNGNATGTFVFPVGDASSYKPFITTAINTTSVRYIASPTSPSIPSGLQTAGLDGTWEVIGSVIPSATVRIDNPQGATNSTSVIRRWDGTNWIIVPNPTIYNLSPVFYQTNLSLATTENFAVLSGCPTPIIVLSTSTPSICTGTSVSFTATTGFSNYDFRVNGTTVQTGTLNTYSTTTLQNGDVLDVIVTHDVSCTTTSNTINIIVANQLAPILVSMPDFVRNTNAITCYFTNQVSTAQMIIPNGQATVGCGTISYEYVLGGETRGTFATLQNIQFNKGITTVRWVARNANNTTSATDEFIVTVLDNIAPLLKVPQDTTFTTDLYSCVALKSNLNIGTPIFSDNCEVRVFNNAPSEFEVGETIVIWTAIDSAGNKTVKNQKVIVKENYFLIPSDSLILVQIYNQMGGNSWSNRWNLNTLASTWQGINIKCGRVASIDLSNNNLTGVLPSSVLNLSRITESNFSLKIGGNRLGFESAEDFVGRISNFTYSPQANLYTTLRESVRQGQAITFTSQTEGDFNTYQWYKNQIAISGATSATYTIQNTIPSDAGTYICKVNNTRATQLTLERRPIILNVEGFVNITDSMALVTLFQQTEGESWNTTWDLSQPVATWEGVTLIGSKLSELDLSSRNMKGTLPDIFDKEFFSELRYLSFFNNNLNGQIPASIGSITTLTYLDLDKNNFEGSLPASFGNLVNLQSFWLSRNNLTSLPDEIGNLKSLKTLYLNGNNFAQLPETIGNLSELLVLNVSDNELSLLPNSITNLRKLVQLYANRNYITVIPITMKNLVNLTLFEINNNNLTALPNDFLQFTNLSRFEIAENQLEFDDLLPYVTTNFSVFNYSPQAPIDEQKDILATLNSSISFTIQTQGNGNAYQWFKNGNPIAATQTLTINRINNKDTGIYTAQITNSSLPDLILQRRLITLNVECQTESNFEIKKPTQTVFCEAQPFVLKLEINYEFSTTTQIRWRKNGIILAFANEKSYTLTSGGIYTAEVLTENSCTVRSNSVEITILPQPKVSINLSKLDNKKILISTVNSQENVTYQWLKDGVPIEDGFQNTYIPTKTAEYSLLILSQSGCSSVSETIIFTQDEITAIEEPKELRNLELFPNPNNGNFFIDFGTNAPNGEPNFMLIDAIGRKLILKTERISSTRHKAIITNLTGGMYYLQIQTKDGVAFRKFIMEE